MRRDLAAHVLGLGLQGAIYLQERQLEPLRLRRPGGHRQAWRGRFAASAAAIRSLGMLMALAPFSG